MDRETYDRFTDEIRSLIAGKNQDPSLSELVLSNEGQWILNGENCNSPEDDILCDCGVWCTLCQKYMGNLLKRANSSIQKGQDNAARFFLFLADFYLFFRPSCLDCHYCLNQTVD